MDLWLVIAKGVPQHKIQLGSLKLVLFWKKVGCDEDRWMAVEG